MGEEREEGANVRMIGMEPDQLVFWMVVTDGGIGLWGL